MKKIFSICVFLTLVMIATPGVADKDIILERIEAEDISDPSWGPTVDDITDSLTAYGGILDYGDARLVSFGPDDTVAYTTFEYKGSVREIKIRHLDGFGDDSFELYIIGNRGHLEDRIYIGEYIDEDPTSDDENWYIHSFDVSPDITHFDHGHDIQLEIVRTGPDWSGYETWGQLAIDWIELRGNGHI